MSDAKLRQSDIELIERSGLFAGNWYHKVYHIPFHRDAIKHYHTEGWEKGYNPSPQFITLEYIMQNPGAKDTNPLLHYLKVGKKRKLELTTEIYRTIENSPLFNREWYCKTYNIPEGEDALEHYLQKGWKLGYNPSVNFCTEEYLNANSDVRNANKNPLAHYLMSGQKEGRPLETNGRELLERSEFFDEQWYRRVYGISKDVDAKLHYMLEGWKLDYNPSPLFITGEYLRQNPDVAAAKKNPLLHYLSMGKKENRRIETTEREFIRESPYFDEEWYRKTYEIPEGVDAKHHYLVWGWKLGYNPSLKFSTNGYLRINGDVNGVGINPLLHYMRSGRKEGREIEEVHHVDAEPVNGKKTVWNPHTYVKRLPALMISFVGFSDGEGEVTPIHLANSLYQLGYPVFVHILGHKKELPDIRKLLNENIYVLKTDDKDEIIKYLKLFQIEVVNTHNLDCERIFSQIALDPRTQVKFSHVASIHSMYDSMYENRFKNAMDIVFDCVDQWTYSVKEYCHYFEQFNLFDIEKFHRIGIMAETESQEEREEQVEKYLDVFFKKNEVPLTEQQPLVSAFVWVEPGKEGLQQCLQSIYHQSYGKVEVCICFSKLDEYSRTVIESYQKCYSARTKLLQLESMEKDLWKLIKDAMDSKGEILWITEKNTVFEYDYLKKLLPSFEDKRVAITYGRSITRDMEIQKETESYHKKGIAEIASRMCLGNPFLISSPVLLRKSMILSEEESWQDYKHKSNLLWKLYIEVLEYNYAVYQTEGYCYQDNSAETVLKDREYYLEKARIVKKLAELYQLPKESVKASYRNLIEEYAQDHHITIGKARFILYRAVNYAELLIIRYRTGR